MSDDATAVPDSPARLFVRADLDVQIDGVAARVTGDGSELRVTSDRPLRLIGAAMRSRPDGLGARHVGFLRDRLRESGLRITVGSRRVDVVGVGDGRTTVLGVPVVAVGLGAVVSATAVVIRRRRRR